MRADGSRGSGEAPTRECPGAGSHRPGIPERHAQEAVRQPQFRRWRSRLRSVDRPAGTQRRAQGARSLGGLLGEPWLQADPEEETAGAPGLAGGPRGARTWSWPERVDLQLEDAGRLCLGRRGEPREGDRGGGGEAGVSSFLRPVPKTPGSPSLPYPPSTLALTWGRKKSARITVEERSWGICGATMAFRGALGAAAAGFGALYLRGRLRPFGQPRASGDPRGGGRRGRRAARWSDSEILSWPQAM